MVVGGFQSFLVLVEEYFYDINSLHYILFFSSLLYMSHNLLGCAITLVAQSLTFTEP